jgi:Fic family protein
MPPGVLFAVYDDKTGAVDYIPPEAGDIEALLDELADYVASSDDNPVVKAAIVHYQLVTIHPFEDGNGRTARLLSDYVLDFYGYGFNQIGSLEEYFAYDIDEYYRSLQMGLPASYYDGRADPPNPGIWISYFVRMMELHARKALEMVSAPEVAQVQNGLSHLNSSERGFLAYLQKKGIREFSPKEASRRLKVTNRTVINWCAALVKSGFLTPISSGQRIRAYALTELAKA